MSQLCFATFARALQKVLIQPAPDYNTPTRQGQKKQVFLAIDKISRYAPQTQQILKGTMFVHLEQCRELFGRSWSKKKTKKGKGDE